MTSIPLATRLAGHRQKDLRTIAAFLGLRQKSQHYDLLWCEEVERGWQEAQQRDIWLSLLSPLARSALLRLLASESLPAFLFFAEYGPLRTTTARQRTPHPSEELFYAGLLHPARPGVIERALFLVTAQELQGLIQSNLDRWQPARENGLHEYPKPKLLLDLSQWLCQLHQQPLKRLQQGRWLPADKLIEWNQRLVEPVPTAEVKTHAQTPALVCIAWWGAAAGLVDANGLTPAAWTWLSDSPTDQLRHLWHGWSEADAELRRSYRQPQMAPPLWVRLLATTLAKLKSSFRVGDVTHHLIAQGVAELGDMLDPFLRAHFASLSALDQQIYCSLEELCELGMLQKSAAPALLGQRMAIPGAAAESERLVDEATPDHLQTTLFFLTPLGHWLLTPSIHRPPDWRWESEGVTLTGAASYSKDSRWAENTKGEGSAWMLQLPAALAPHRMVQLAAFGDFAGRSTGTQDVYSSLYFYTITPQTLARAATAGHKLANFLAALAPLQLTPTQIATLQSWYERDKVLELALYPLIRAKKTMLLAEIAQNPTLRPFLGEWLSPTTMSWLGDAEEFAFSVREAGYQVNNQVASQDQHTESQGEAKGIAPTQSQIGAIWLAGQLYNCIGNYMPLPIPIDSRYLQSLFAQLPEQQQAALIPLWQQCQQNLLNLLDHLPFMPPPAPSDPQKWRPLLAAAIQDELEVEILYFSAGRNLLTQRWVQPYHFFEQDGIPYLRGYCHAMGAVLTFRLDRLQNVLGQRKAAMPPEA